jgi:hypothetical protein
MPLLSNEQARLVTILIVLFHRNESEGFSLSSELIPLSDKLGNLKK